MLGNNSIKGKLYMNPIRNFASRGKKNKGNQSRNYNSQNQEKTIKPSDVGAFSPTFEPIIQLENGYYLLYYHRQRIYTMFFLYLRYLLPIAGLIYLIKKNPFYKSYPIMLPFMVVMLLFISFR